MKISNEIDFCRLLFGVVSQTGQAILGFCVAKFKESKSTDFGRLLQKHHQPTLLVGIQWIVPTAKAFLGAATDRRKYLVLQDFLSFS